jgi:ubiquinone biosynthesis protein
MKPIESASRRFRADVWEFISKFQTGSLSDLEMGTLLEEFFAKLKRHRLRCPADIVYLIKAITTIEGVAEMICPEFDLVGHVRPQIEGLVKRRYGFKAVRRRVQNSTLAYAELVENAPRDLKAFSKMIQQEQLAVQLRHDGLEDLTEEIEHASKNISFSLHIAALLVCGAILFLADAAGSGSFGVLSALGTISVVLGGVVAAYRAIQTTFR